jgi:hypothetical protein
MMGLGEPLFRDPDGPQPEDSVAVGLTAVSLIEATAADDMERVRALLPKDPNDLGIVLASTLRVAASVISVLDKPDEVFATLRELIIDQWGSPSRP